MKLKTIIITMLSAVILAMPLSAEYVFLKDGAIIEGTITSDAAGSVAIKDKDKKIRQIPRTNIMRILYTELYMGKVYVQKTDGKNVICYMVDEDRESYTFRKELYSPEEFKLRRDQVLFMARGNPTGLEAEPDTYSTDLKWFPPYNPVKRYRIYVKGPGDKSFILADESRSKSSTIKDLKSNTKYQFHVTAVDDAGDESIPSNEVTITTKNVAPDKPVISSLEKLTTGGYKVIWNPSTDPDGKLAGYRVYKKTDGKNIMLTETKKTEYNISDFNLSDRIFITAFDDLKSESEQSAVYIGHSPKMWISVNPAFIYPLGKLKDMADPGYGAVVKFEMSNYFIPQLELGLEASFFYLQGKSDFIESESKVNSIMFAPAMINAGYAFYPFENFAIIPNVSAGAVFVQYDYNYFDIPDSEDKNVTESQVDPAAGFGLNLRYSITESIYINLSADYRVLFEESDNFSFCTASIGAGMRF